MCLIHWEAVPHGSYWKNLNKLAVSSSLSLLDMLLLNQPVSLNQQVFSFITQKKKKEFENSFSEAQILL